jgi:hypothetical protein
MAFMCILLSTTFLSLSPSLCFSFLYMGCHPTTEASPCPLALAPLALRNSDSQDPFADPQVFYLKTLDRLGIGSKVEM